MINRKGINILLAAFIAVVMVVAMVMPVLAQQGAQLQVTDFEEVESDCPDVAIDSQGNVHIVFEGNAGSSGDYGEIWYTMLNNDGNTLIDDTLIDDTYRERKPVIGVDSQDQVHIVWQSYGGKYIAYTKLAPYLDDRDGDSATLATIELVAATDLYGGDGSDSYMDPRIAIDSNDNVHVVWESYDDYEIAYMKLNSGGVVLIPYTVVEFTSSDWQRRPFVAVDSNNNPHIIWNDDDGTSEDEMFYAMLDGSNGNHLIDTTLITDDDGDDSHRSDIVVDDEDMVHIFYTDDNSSGSEQEIFYTKLDPSLDDQDGDSASESAITVIADTRLTADNGDKSCVPQAAIQCGYIHVTWKGEDEKDEWGMVSYMVIDTDGNGVVPETVLTIEPTLDYTHSYDDWVVSVAVDESGKAHIVWCDDRTDNAEIWYTSYQGPSCRPVGGEAYPVKTVNVIAPLIGIAIAAVAGIFVIRLRRAS